MRTAARLATMLVATTALLAGCAGADRASTQPDAPAAPTTGDSAFPVSITHAYGETTIEAEPQRVVTIGFNEADFALALGVVPVGVRDFFGEFDETQRVWAQEQLGGQTPADVGGTELNVEAVAALEPDLILGVYSFIDQAQYDSLSAIAPTVFAPSATAAATWQEQTRITGQALGRSEQAEQLVADVEAQFADVRAQNPQFEGKSAGISLNLPGTPYLLGADDLRTQFFTDLGFTVPEASSQLSPETVTEFDQDVTIALGSTEADMNQYPLWPTLASVQQGRVVYGGAESSEFSGALGFGSPLSLPYALELITPQLVEAVPAS